MARVKKETKIETPKPLEEETSMNAEGANMPQTDSTGEPEAITDGLVDLELVGVTTLNPDDPLPLEDKMLHTDPVEGAQLSSEQTHLHEDESKDAIPLTDIEQGEDNFTDSAETTAAGPLSGDEGHPDLAEPQTGLGSNMEDSSLIGATSVAEGEGVDGRAEKSLPEEKVLDGGDQAGDDDQSETGQPKRKLRMPGRRGPRVVSIDAERTVETDADRLRSDLLDLVESLKSKKILTGTIQGVERLADDPEMSYAVTYHGDYKVIIPVLEAVEEPVDYRGQPRGDVLHYLLNKRLGAEVDYVVKGIDQQSGLIAASRMEAMALKRREYYFRTDREGNYQIYEGIRAEARVVSVIRAGIFVDLFGAECYIPLRELSYQRWVDASAHYQPGQRVLVKVLEVDRSDHSNLRVSVSVKQAGENPYEKALKKFSVGSRYVGTVSMVDLTGVFVSLDGGIDCLCTYPKRGRPPRGCRVTVRILGIDHESNRIWGVITHMSTAH